MVNSRQSSTIWRPSKIGCFTRVGLAKSKATGSQLPAFSRVCASQTAMSTRFPTSRKPHSGLPRKSASHVLPVLVSHATSWHQPHLWPVARAWPDALQDHVARIITCRPTNAQTHTHPCITHLVYGSNTRNKSEIWTGTMSNSSFGLGE